ncbi:MAG: catalase [Lachnospiraceae bacterium]|jgi:hypothetical protein|nr:catalase [Lachnospiraceae bacterium]
MHAWKHFKTITFHKFLVMKGCFAVGLYRQGLLHDLSKYTPSEFLVGAKYYQGNRSPNNAEREEIGYSSAWLHHKGRNRHHYEYWIDYCADEGTDKHGMKPAPMPDRYIVEMFMDRVAASKVYNGKDYTDQDALAYYERGAGKMRAYLHPYTRKRLERLLHLLAEHGEKKTFAYIRRRRRRGGQISL